MSELLDLPAFPGCVHCGRPIGAQRQENMRSAGKFGVHVAQRFGGNPAHQLMAGLFGGMLAAYGTKHCVLCINGPGLGKKPLLYWSEVPGGSPAEYLDNAGLAAAPAEKAAVAAALAKGERGLGYMGHANCRICDEALGSADMIGWGFVWPEKAEHYLLVHGVWTPQCMDLYHALPAELRK